MMMMMMMMTMAMMVRVADRGDRDVSEVDESGWWCRKISTVQLKIAYIFSGKLLSCCNFYKTFSLRFR